MRAYLPAGEHRKIHCRKWPTTALTRRACSSSALRVRFVSFAPAGNASLDALRLPNCNCCAIIFCSRHADLCLVRKHLRSFGIAPGGERLTVPEIQQTRTLIVGFGFSCLPLLRELDRTGEEYTIVSDPQAASIWSTLENAGRLDFDLVSSYYTSFYTFDLVKDFKRDMYPLASEFYAMHRAYYERYKHRIITKHVTRIENYEGYSYVHTDDGSCYQAGNVVIATAFTRKIHSSLSTFDYKMTNQTIVFDTVGDSSNLMISKLLPGNNKIICLTNGFLAFDKFFCQNGKTATLDQFEFHTFAVFRRFYRAFVGGSPFLFDQFFKNTSGIFNWKLKFARLLSSEMFWFKYPETIHRDEVDRKKCARGAAMPNGLIAIKYWPIDMYEQMFGKDLENTIRRGCLLNDLPLWIEEGMVKIFRKAETTVDRESKTLSYKGQTIHFDHMVEGGPEKPRLPQIFRFHAGTETAVEYAYEVRKNYLGIVPESLSNIYLLGIIRPFTGGLANISEIQSLFIHKMIAKESFQREVRETLPARIEAYNDKYNLSARAKPTDHVVYYGTYTEEVARATGIAGAAKNLRSLGDLRRWLLFPNNAFKYRQTGEYEVPDCSGFVKHIDKEHDYFSSIVLSVASIGIYHAIVFIFLAKLYLHNDVSLYGLGALLLLDYFVFTKGFIVLQLLSASVIFISPYKLWRFAFLIVSLIAMMSGPPVTIAVIFGIEILMTALTRRYRKDLSRHIFNDMANKREYRWFIPRYMEAYRRVAQQK
jgi:hypothetical protein